MPADLRPIGMINTDFRSLTDFMADSEKRSQIRQMATDRRDQARASAELQDIMATAPDELSAIGELRKRGYLKPAADMEKSYFERQKSISDVMKADHEREAAMYQDAASIFNTMKDSASSYQQGQGLLRQRIQGKPGADKILSLVNRPYDPQQTPVLLDQLIDSTLKAQDQETKKTEATKLLFGADPRIGVLNHVSLIDNQADLDHLRSVVQASGRGKALLDLIPQTYSKEAQARAGQESMTPMQRQTLAGQAANDARADAVAKRQEANEAARLSIERARLGLETRRVGIAEKEAANSATGGAKLSVAQQTDLADMQTLRDMAGDVEKIGDEIKWSGVGGMMSGTANQFMARNFGKGTPKEQDLRNGISNITATIAKLRGGTAFTPNEQKLLEQYTPTIDDNSMVIKSKLTALKRYIELKKKNLLEVTGGHVTETPKAANAKDPLGIR